MISLAKPKRPVAFLITIQRYTPRRSSYPDKKKTLCLPVLYRPKRRYVNDTQKQLPTSMVMTKLC